MDKIKKILLNVCIVLGIVVFVVFLGKGYFRYIRVTEQARVDQVVRESATQSIKLIRERIYHDMDYIKAEADYVSKQEIPIYSNEILQHISNSRDASKVFKDINIVTTDGNMYDSDGTVLENLSIRPYFKEALNGNYVISNMEQTIDAKEVISIAIPIFREGHVIGIMNGRFMMSVLTEVLSAEFFGGKGYSYMADADGNVFVMSDHPNADSDFTNLYDELKSLPSVSDELLRKTLKNMKEGREGQLFYEWNGDQRTMSYMPVGINDWYLLSILPNDLVASRAIGVMQQIFVLTGILILILALSVFYAYLQRRKNQRSLANIHQELLTIYNTIPGGVFQCLSDEGITVTEANDGFYKFLGYTKEQFQNQYSNQLIQIMRQEDVERVKQSLAKQLEVGEKVSDEVQLICSDGTMKWLLINGEVVYRPKGPDLVYCCFTDIWELKRTQEELREAKQRYDLIIAETQDIIFEWNPQNSTIIHSKMYKEKFGEEPITEGFPQCILDGHIVCAEDESTFLNIYARIENGDRFSTDEIRIRKADGKLLWCRVSATAIRDEANHLCRVVGMIEDIDCAKRKLQEITDIAQHDALTGLYNKMTTDCLIEKQLTDVDGCGVLLIVDIDDFKSVNDTLGHSMGDAALVEFAKRLRGLFRTTDIVGRVGGDEFVVFMEGIEQQSDLEQKLLHMSNLFQKLFYHNDISCSISCSIGAVLFPTDGRSFAELFHKADLALYFVKQHGKNGFQIYSAEKAFGVEKKK